MQTESHQAEADNLTIIAGQAAPFRWKFRDCDYWIR